MRLRTDAAVFVVACLIIAGCAPLARQPSSRVSPPANPPASLTSSPTLAITTPPAANGEIRQAAGQSPAVPTSITPSEDPIRRLQREAVAAYAKVPCYIARLRRREVVGGRMKPEEVLV